MSTSDHPKVNITRLRAALRGDITPTGKALGLFGEEVTTNKSEAMAKKDDKQVEKPVKPTKPVEVKTPAKGTPKEVLQYPTLPKDMTETGSVGGIFPSMEEEAKKQHDLNRALFVEENSKIKASKAKPRADYVVGITHAREVVLLRGPEGFEISRRIFWRLPAFFSEEVEVGQVYAVKANLTNRKVMDFLSTTIEITGVVGLIPTE